MSTTVTYKGSTLTTAENQTRVLETAGKYMEDDVTIVDVTSGSGGITQDQDGYLVLSPDGGGGGGGGGLEYETGTITPNSDSISLTINFTNSHDGRPFYAIVIDTTETLASDYSYLYYAFMSFYDAFGLGYHYSDSSYAYGKYVYSYKTSSGQSNGSGNISTVNGLNTYAISSSFTPGTSASTYFRAGRVYKWLAVWMPTT